MDLCEVMSPTFSYNRNAAKCQPPATNPIRGLLWGTMGRLKHKHRDMNNSHKIRSAFSVTMAAVVLFSIATVATVYWKHFTMGRMCPDNTLIQLQSQWRHLRPSVALLNENIYSLSHPAINSNPFVKFLARLSGRVRGVLDLPSCGPNRGSQSKAAAVAILIDSWSFKLCLRVENTLTYSVPPLLWHTVFLDWLR